MAGDLTECALAARRAGGAAGLHLQALAPLLQVLHRSVRDGLVRDVQALPGGEEGQKKSSFESQLGELVGAGV